MENSGVIPSVSAKQMSPPGSYEATAASGNGANIGADHLEDAGSYERLIQEIVPDLKEQSVKEEALPDSSKKQGAENRAGGENEQEEEREELPQRRRRRRRAIFKRLGSVGRPPYRAKVKEPTFFCHRCPASFIFKRELEYHIVEHTGRPLLPCEFCPRQFPTGRMLSSHCARKHGR
ncbi:uncharacterized protein LOC144115101 isoform X1 [Amblyomma americanum]